MEFSSLSELIMQYGPLVAYSILLIYSSEKDKDFLKKQLEDANDRNKELADAHKKEIDSIVVALENHTLAINNLSIKLGGDSIENIRD